MYKITVPSKGNIAPWEVDFPSRCRLLREYFKEGIPIALLLYERADTSTFRYRAYNMMQITRYSRKWKSIYFFMNEIEMLLPYLSKISLAIIIRVRWTHVIEKFINEVKSNHIPLLFDVDDLIFDTKYLPIVTNTLNVPFKDDRDYEFWFGCISRIEYTAARADGFIATNSFLGDRLKAKFNKQYGVIPNFLNEEQLSISEKCCEQKKNQISRNPFTIGYFSGTPSHVNDFRMISQEIILLLEEFKNIQFKVVGYMEFPREIQPMIKNGRVTFTPLVDFLELQCLISQVDVNVVPLVKNIFTNCKSELKYFEAAVVNTITCATPTEVYRKAINHGENGFLCEQGKWYDTLKYIYKENEGRQEILKTAYKHVFDCYTGSRILEKIEETYDKFSIAE
ncbi:MAG: hypothetical protein APF84_02990 [Gracilibacter sp. BRH_c7a]|nr:MAG: hypothetical protein APF84_02990 [Gracilibacter sp. BRH_c7a]